MKVSNYKDYAYFNYIDYLDRNCNEIPKPEKLTYGLGDVVYVKDTNSIGVVIGCIDEESAELRTDVDGMQCFSNLKLATLKDFKRKSIRMSPKLYSEIIQK